MKLLENVSLKKINTFGIDATCRYLVEIDAVDTIQEYIQNRSLNKLNRLVLGGGSNLLFTKNFDGIVLKNNLKGIDVVREDDDFVYLKAAAGEVWHNFVLNSIERKLGGIENLSLIPGCVGASPMQNIGAYGVEIKDTFYELEAIHLEDGKTQKFTAKDCEFGYRESVFKHRFKNQFIICSVTFRLAKKPVFNTSYGAIEQQLATMQVKELSLRAISDAVCQIRRSKLPNPEEIGNAGSFFKNPVVASDKYDALKKLYPEIVGYRNNDKEVKLAAGWLIEQCGWKGYRLGDAGVHKNQSLVLVNYDKASGNEILTLSQNIIESVQHKFGVSLEREVNII